MVEAGARLGDGVEIGPFCHVGAQGRAGRGREARQPCRGRRRHRDRRAHAACSRSPRSATSRRTSNIAASRTTLRIGADCLIREGVTMNPGTAGGGGETSVGDKCVFLANCHVAHDCRLSEGVLLSNNVMLAGHCRDRRIRDPQRRLGGASVRAHRRARLSRRPDRRRRGPDPVRPGDRQSRLARRPQRRRHEAPRLRAGADSRRCAAPTGSCSPAPAR